MLFLGIMQHQAKLHALAGQFAVGQAAQARQHGHQARLGVFLDGLARGAALLPVARHFFQVGHQQLGHGLQEVHAALAVAAGALLDVEVGVRTVARVAFLRRALAAGRRRTGAVQVLAPQQEFDRVVAGGHVGLVAVGFVQYLGQQRA